MKKAYGVFSILAVLVISAIFDIFYHRFGQFDPVSATPPISSLFWLQISSTIFITIVLLALSWRLFYAFHGHFITVVSIFLGGCVLILTTIAGTRFVAQLDISSSNLLRMWLNDIVSSKLSLTSHSAAFVLCMGIIRLLPFVRRSIEVKKENGK